MTTDRDNGGDDSVLIAKEPCPACGSRDNLARYSDGHAWCFSPGCKHYEPGEGEDSGGPRSRGDLRPDEGGSRTDRSFQPIDVTVSALPKRGLSERTCAFWGYGVGETSSGAACHVAQFRTANGTLVAQKLRTADKQFPILKDKGSKLPLYGMWLWRGDRRSLIVTEGELDALSVSQAQDLKYPVVSVPNGAQGAAADIRRHYDWVCEFEKVVIMFDGDEPGQKAAQEVAELLPPGMAHIADLGEFKDANEALVAGKPSAIVSAFWNAKPYAPDGIVDVDDLIDEACEPPQMGLPWPWKALTDATYGVRPGELHGLGGGVGCGKTEVFKELIEHFAFRLDMQTGVLFLEEPPKKTLKVLAGKIANKRYHLPKEEYDPAELRENILKLRGKVRFYNHFGAKDWGTIKSRIRYMAVSLGIKVFFIDHLTALIAKADDERRELDGIMSDLATLTEELGLYIFFISHLTTPKTGPTHEEGGRVYESQFTGSRAIMRWSHNLYGIERNKQEKGSPTTFRILKERESGDATGLTIGLGWDTETGRYHECQLNESTFSPVDDEAAALDI